MGYAKRVAIVVLSMKDPYGNGHLIYYYIGETIHMYVLCPIKPDEDTHCETSWNSFKEIMEDFRDMTFELHNLKWARLRGG